MTRYLLDTNTFIQAKNLHYQFGFCSAYWDWIYDGHTAGVLFSTQMVLKELNDGHKGDHAKIWANKMPSTFFVKDKNDPSVMANYSNVISWSTTSTHYKQNAKDEFARSDKADALLIATAKTHGYIIASQELSNPDCKRRILIPDAAMQFNVKTIFIYDLLNNHSGSNFTFI